MTSQSSQEMPHNLICQDVLDFKVRIFVEFVDNGSAKQDVKPFGSLNKVERHFTYPSMVPTDGFAFASPFKGFITFQM